MTHNDIAEKAAELKSVADEFEIALLAATDAVTSMLDDLEANPEVLSAALEAAGQSQGPAAAIVGDLRKAEPDQNVFARINDVARTLEELFPEHDDGDDDDS